MFLSVEVLLDMKASGSELGWLTMPYEEGVSIYTTLRHCTNSSPADLN